MFRREGHRKRSGTSSIVVARQHVICHGRVHGTDNKGGNTCVDRGSPSTSSSSMMQGAAMVSLHRSPESFTSLVQHPSPSCEHPSPPHRPQLSGQHTLDASNPGRPLAQVSLYGGDGRHPRTGRFNVCTPFAWTYSSTRLYLENSAQLGGAVSGRVCRHESRAESHSWTTVITLHRWYFQVSSLE